MNDKIQSLSSLDVFLLALIDSGVATSYAMREEAGISVGASRPALHRLSALALVAEGAAGARGKVTFKLTASGRRAKSASLNFLLADYRLHPPSDIESILRVAALALSAAKPAEAVELMTRAADRFRRIAREVGKPAAENESGVAGIYHSMAASASANQLAAAHKTLSSLAAVCGKLPVRPRIQRARPHTKK
jgi:hypothetical protein